MRFWQAVAFLETDQLLDVARAAEELGFYGITTSDHILYPRTLRSRYPYTADGAPLWSPETPWPDSWCLISAMAAVTTRLRFTNSVYVAAARDVFTVAKLVATSAVISGGRVSLGVGAGWMREEFELLGQDFDTRGPRLDEMIDVLRTLWAGGWVEHHGTWFDIPPLQLAPAPPSPVPIWCGGISRAAVRRAVTRCDGWIGEGAREPDEVVEWVRLLVAERRAQRGGEAPFDILTAVSGPPDVDLYRRLEDLGVTGIICAPWMTAAPVAGNFRSPLPDKLAAMERFAHDVIARMH